MTSEREWGCYPQVPGLGICQLARHDGIDAVLVTPWRWDGRERRRVEPGGGVTDTTEDGSRLHRLLGGESTGWLVRRARDRLEAGRPLIGTVTLAGATVEQRRAIERLTGRPPRSGTSLSVSLPEVDRVLRESGAAPGGLAEAVALLTGPLRDLNRDRTDIASAWAAAFAPLDGAVAARPELAAWRGWLDATGVVRRLAPSPDAGAGAAWPGGGGATATAVAGHPRSGGSPPNAAATRTPSMMAVRPGRSRCPRSARWPACRSRPTSARSPAVQSGPPRGFTLTNSPRWCSVSACPATLVPRWAGCWHCSGKPDSRRRSLFGSCAATMKRCPRDPCGFARIPW